MNSMRSNFPSVDIGNSAILAKDWQAGGGGAAVANLASDSMAGQKATSCINRLFCLGPNGEKLPPTSPPFPCRNHGLFASIFRRRCKCGLDTLRDGNLEFIKIAENISVLYEEQSQAETSVNEIDTAANSTQEQESCQIRIGDTHVFSYDEVREATNFFHSSRKLVDGGYDSLYLGKLKDGMMVTVRILDDKSEHVLQFLKDIDMFCGLRHRYLRTLHGFIADAQEPLLVYEYFPNGTVADHLHGSEAARNTLTWALRLRIAIETAEALAFLHSVSIIHCDVKTDNILLDNKFHVKVADFGLCNYFYSDDSDNYSTLGGTEGYTDPEYSKYGMLTDKSDVYSFGVVLLELISGKLAVDANRDEVYLLVMGHKMIERGKLEQLVDPNFRYHDLDYEVRRTVKLVAKLVCWCLQPECIKRPPMADVAEILKAIRDEIDPRHFRESDGIGVLEDIGSSSGNEIGIAADSSRIGDIRIFSHDELREATDNFLRKLGDGGYGSVYLGKLKGGQKVAVKVLSDNNELGLFMTEVEILSSLRHKNLLTFIGCTSPGSQEHFLVYEYMPNGTVANHLHGQQVDSEGLRWHLRIRIAIETAEALAYLHFSPNRAPIVHRDVKTDNILLDDMFHVKVADFGLSSIFFKDLDPTNSSSVRGTLGYLDPEYDQNHYLTEKSDVYSFGVVLMELISGMKAVDVERDEIYLDSLALKRIRNNELDQLVDIRLGYHSDPEVKKMIDPVAEIACMCLRPEGHSRPQMVEVFMVMKGIRDGSPISNVAELLDITRFVVQHTDTGPTREPLSDIGHTIQLNRLLFRDNGFFRQVELIRSIYGHNVSSTVLFYVFKGHMAGQEDGCCTCSHYLESNNILEGGEQSGCFRRLIFNYITSLAAIEATPADVARDNYIRLFTREQSPLLDFIRATQLARQ